MANFGHFQNALIFLILGVFWSSFCTQQLLSGRTIVFRTFWAFLIFDPNWPCCKDYSLCVVANFDHFQNAPIFRILDVFWSGFLHTTTLMLSYNRFSHLLSIFNFWPKLTILQRLYSLRAGQFLPFLKCSHFSNIRCFLERFFAHNNSKVVEQSFFAPFGHF